MDALDKILDVILIGIWITSVTYLLGLLIKGCFGKWKQHRERTHKFNQHRIILKQEDGDATKFELLMRKKEDEQ